MKNSNEVFNENSNENSITILMVNFFLKKMNFWLKIVATNVYRNQIHYQKSNAFYQFFSLRLIINFE